MNSSARLLLNNRNILSRCELLGQVVIEQQKYTQHVVAGLKHSESEFTLRYVLAWHTVTSNNRSGTKALRDAQASNVISAWTRPKLV